MVLESRLTRESSRVERGEVTEIARNVLGDFVFLVKCQRFLLELVV